MSYRPAIVLFLAATIGTLFLSDFVPGAVEMALAQAGAGATPQQLSPMQTFMKMIPLFVIVFFIFYFLVVRPQEKRMREHEALITDLGKGTQVVTSGGIIGRVAGVEKDHILLEIANNVKIRVENAHVSRKFDPNAADSAQKEPVGSKASKKKGKAA